MKVRRMRFGESFLNDYVILLIKLKEEHDFYHVIGIT